jgi:hypothetical protein
LADEASTAGDEDPHATKLALDRPDIVPAGAEEAARLDIVPVTAGE